MVTWAGQARNFHQIRLDGSTPYYAGYGVEYKGQVLPFGETVLFKAPVSKTRAKKGGGTLHKADLAWERGIWVGKSTTNDQHVLLTRRGKIEARTVRRLEQGKRYDRALFGELAGFPWQDKLITVPKPVLSNELRRYDKSIPIPLQLGATPGRSPVMHPVISANRQV